MTAKEIKESEVKPVADNYMIINVAYDRQLVLNFKDGLALMASLSKAELYVSEYSTKIDKIIPIKKDNITTTIIGAAKYKEFKLAGILDNAQSTD